jgi:hypothetical protein
MGSCDFHDGTFIDLCALFGCKSTKVIILDDDDDHLNDDDDERDHDN